MSTNNYIKSCLNYTGGKYKLLNQILPLFPQEIETFIDLFCGGANVAINVSAKEIICIDIQKEIIRLFNNIKQLDKEEVFLQIEKIISQYKLSDSFRRGYEVYNCESGKGLAEYNKEKYLLLREKYNSCSIEDYNESFMFYVLTVFGFNNQIRFNKKGGFNIPVGKRDFNENIRGNLDQFIDRIKEKDIVFKHKDFRDLDLGGLSINDFIYADPPYLITTAAYNEQGGWTEKDELDLLSFLDRVNDRNIKFALSNVLENKGKENVILKEWAKKYTVNYLNYNYNNSNYQSKSRESKTVEVLITNYNLE